MTDRYAPAAFVSALLHAVVIALLVTFSLQSRDEAREIPRVVEVILNGSMGATTEVPEPVDFRGLIPPIPAPRPVVPESVTPVETQSPVTPPKNVTKPPPGVHPRPVSPPKPASTTRPPVSSSYVDPSWRFESNRDSSHATTSTAVSNQASVQNSIDREAYFAEVRRLLQAALRLPPGMSAQLSTTVEFLLAADGTLSGGKIVSTSGDVVFDRAVLAAVAHTRAPVRPDGLNEVMKTTLSTTNNR